MDQNLYDNIKVTYNLPIVSSSANVTGDTYPYFNIIMLNISIPRTFEQALEGEHLVLTLLEV